MQYYKLRTDLTNVSSSTILEIVCDLSNTYAFCKEGSKTDNPHLHIYMETDVHQKTIRSRFRAKGLKGNGAISLTQCEQNPIQYLAYMMKEKKFSHINIPPEVIEEAKQYDDNVKKQMKERKEAKKSILQRLTAYVSDHVNQLDLEATDTTIIGALVVKYHYDNNLLVRKFAIQSYVHTLQLQIIGNEVKDDSPSDNVTAFQNYYNWLKDKNT